MHRLLKHLLTISVGLVICALAAYFQAPQQRERIYVGSPDFEERGGELWYHDIPFTGVTVETYPDGSVFRTTNYLRGLKHGLSEEFGITGVLRTRWNYDLGKKNGWQEGWYIEGGRKFKMRYRNGLLDGTSTEWYLSGDIARHRVYENGVELAQKVLYESGELFSNFVIRGGRKYGLDGGELCMDFKKEGEF